MPFSYYRQCNRCVMDTSDTEIVFDANGHCNHCTSLIETKSRIHISEAKLNKLVRKMLAAGKGRPYDCILGISGGADSCYAALLLKQLGLRVLAVHMDNGWDSEIAVRNIHHIVDRLGIDYKSYVLDWEEFKDLQLAFLKASVPEIESPTDMAIPGALHKVAAEHNVKYIISANNLQTEGILPRSWHYNSKDLVYLKSIHRKFGSGQLKNFPVFGYKQEILYKLYHRIKIIYFLNYVPYSKQEAIDMLKEKMGWEYYGGKHHESWYTKFIQSYVLPLKFNIDYRRATFSSQICAGELSRKDALQKLQGLPYDPNQIEEEKKYVLKKLGLNNDQFEYIMSMPVKTYKDYLNDETRLDFFYRIYKKLRPSLNLSVILSMKNGFGLNDESVAPWLRYLH